MGGEELCEYNAADCRVTIKAWLALQGDLESERHVYEHDVCLAELCAEMHRAGIRVDRKKQRELSRLLAADAERYQVQMRKLARNPDFRSSRTSDVRRALFETLAVRKLKFTETGLASTDKSVIEALRGDDTDVGRFATLLVKRREALKAKATYVDYPKEIMFAAPGSSSPADAARAHYSWGARERRDERTTGGGHTVSGRLASRIQSAPRYNPRNTPDRVREIYIPAPGCEFVYFDVSQGEPRVAAYLSGDPERIKTTLGDVHAANAKIMFPEAAAKGWLDGDAKKDPQRGKPCRDLAKNMGLAIDYFAEADRVWQYLHQNRFGPDGKPLYGAPRLNTVKAIIAKIRHVYRVYVRFVYANLERTKKLGYMRDPILGRIRWLGWSPVITDVANYPIQSCLAAVMNLRCLALRRSDRFLAWAKLHPEILTKVGLEANPNRWPRLPRGVPLVAQIHDAVIYDTPRSLVPAVKSAISDIWARPIDLPGGKLILPIDLKTGRSWAAL